MFMPIGGAPIETRVVAIMTCDLVISMKCNHNTSVKLNIVSIGISTGFKYEVTN